MTHNTEAARLREALDKYGQHKQGCNVARALPFEIRRGGLSCTCGFDDARAALQSQPSEANAELVEALEDACGIALADLAVKIYFDTESGASKAHALLRKIWREANRTGQQGVE